MHHPPRPRTRLLEHHHHVRAIEDRTTDRGFILALHDSLIRLDETETGFVLDDELEYEKDKLRARGYTDAQLSMLGRAHIELHYRDLLTDDHYLRRPLQLAPCDQLAAEVVG